MNDHEQPRSVMFGPTRSNRVKTRPKADSSDIGKQKTKGFFPFVVLKPRQGSGFSCSVPKPARTANIYFFAHST